VRVRHHLYGREAMALLAAATLDDDALVAELVDQHALAHAGYSNADGLRQLAALSLVLARRIDERTRSSAT
jgi:hypothetical protein